MNKYSSILYDDYKTTIYNKQVNQYRKSSFTNPDEFTINVLVSLFINNVNENILSNKN